MLMTEEDRHHSSFQLMHRQRIRSAFGGAKDYDENTGLQQRVAVGLAARISEIDLPDQQRLLEIGCGTGYLTKAMADVGIKGRWLVTDLAPEMLKRCRKRLSGATQDRSLRYAVLDGEYGTPTGGPFDLICSSLAFQWFEDPISALSRMRGWLAPGGHIIFTSLGPKTFSEWRAAHDRHGLSAGTPIFRPVDHFQSLRPLSLKVETLIERYCDSRTFLWSLKAIGAGVARPLHRPLSPSCLRKVMADLDREGCNITYEVVTCCLSG